MTKLKTFKCVDTTISVPIEYSDVVTLSAFKSIKKDNDNFRDWHYPFVNKSITIIDDVLSGDFKYVIFKRHTSRDSFDIFPIIFTKDINHDYLSESTFLLDEDFCEPISAGFVSISDCDINVFGRSETLDLDSNFEDDFPLISSFIRVDI